MRHAALMVLAVLALCAQARPVEAYSCPIVMKEADEAITRAETALAKGTSIGENRTAAERALAEAKKALAEARKEHEGARAKLGHAAAVRKAKISRAFAEEAQVLAD